MTLGILSLILGGLICWAGIANRKNYTGIARFLFWMILGLLLILYGANRIRLDFVKKQPIDINIKSVISETKKDSLS